MKITPLPPLNSLVVFEASARHMSFTRAADELHVTQGAISRQVKHLESYLGKTLFSRDKKRLTLTATGETYYTHIRKTLLELSAATADQMQWQNDQQITVVTTNAMASFWLLPKYQQFQEQHPDINMRILAVDSQKDINQSEFDLALFYCRQAPQEMHSTPLFKEKVFPVCSPAYLAKNPQLNCLENLNQATLLSLDVNEEWFNWTDWFNACQLPLNLEASRKLNMNNYLLVVQAALNGQGLALAWENLVDDYLNSGLLVAPVSTEFVTTSQFYLLEPITTRKAKSGVTLFRQWLLNYL